MLLACNRAHPLPMTQVIAGQTMGTSYTIKLGPADTLTTLQETTREVEAELERVNAQMSTYLTTSELSRFNHQTQDEWFSVSQETAEVVHLALELYRNSDGAFDVTVGPLVNLWGFGPNGRPQSVPSQPTVAETLTSVGAQKLEVRLSPPALRKLVPRLQVDLSAIAKGHGVDRVAAVLERLHYASYFVEIGGEVRVKGTRPGGDAWRIGIERPDSAARSVQRIAELRDQSMATSGNYRNFYDLDGRRFSHTIDPKTGYPKVDSIASATVVADNCALADGIATSMMAAGFESGLRLAEKHNWAVYLIRINEQGELESAASSKFTESFPENSETENDKQSAVSR